MQNLHAKLLGWYGKNRRDLPWRKNKDPYRVWLSEIMCQQTRVEAVLPYYERFLSHFPTVADLAKAPEEKVTNLWAGLGYYSRARNLHKTAKIVSEAGNFPETPEELSALPGIGEYTAAAIASIAFGKNLAAIDGNLERVIARLIALRKNPKTEGKQEIREFAAELVQYGRAGDVNQALMDLSAKTCLPRQPKCTLCPIEKFCEGTEIAAEIPVRPVKKAKTILDARGVILFHQGSLLLAKRPKGEWLSGMWDIPWWLGDDRNIPGTRFGEHECSRTITNHKIRFRVHFVRGKTKSIQKSLKDAGEEFRWIRIEDLHGINLPRPSEKALSEALRVSGLFSGSDR